jgi:hypothetical protein
MTDSTKSQTSLHSPEPDRALKRLDSLVGTWDLRGHTLDSGEDNITGWTTFEWMPGDFFLEVRGEMDFKGFKAQSLEIIAYDPATRTFPAMVYSNMSGNVLPYYWDVQGITVTHWMDDSKFMGTLSDDGKTLTGGWRPLAGTDSSDENSYDVVMTRVK